MTIQIFATGGTFDKEYDEITGEFVFRDTHLSEILAKGRLDLDLSIERLMMIDSLDMTEDDRALIAKHCAEADTDHILITHGTDTMVETARVIAQKELEKTIVLTGAMIPYVFHGSDAVFNLASSLAFLQTLPPGVYISMNGQYFHWDNVYKNKEKGRFETLH